MSNVTETKTILGAGKTASSSLAKNRNTPDIIRTSRPAESDGRGEGERKVPVTTMLESTRTSKIAKVERKKEDGTVVKAENVQKLLARQLAYLSGGMDGCHPILTFPASSRESLSQTSDADLSILLLYFIQLTRWNESHLGFTVMMDMRDVDWSVSTALLTRLQSLSCMLIHQAVILRSSSFVDKLKLWMNKTVSKFKVIVVQSTKDLHGHIDPEELTSEFGGSLPYSHSEWINMRKHVERFIDGCDDVKTLLNILTSSVIEVSRILSLGDAKERLVKARENAETIQSVSAKTLSEGKVLLHSMQHTEDMSPLLATWTCDYVNATWVVQERLRLFVLESKAALELLRNHMTDLEQCVVFHEFKEQAEEVIQSIDDCFDQLTLTKNSIGNGSSAAQALLQKHIAMDIRLQDTRPKCESVLEQASEFNSEHYAVDRVQQMAKTVESKLPDIKMMMKDRSSLLEKAVEFFTLVDKVMSWCDQGKSLLAQQAIDCALTQSGAAETLTELNTFIDSRVSLARLQELAEMIPGDVAQQQAVKALQKCGEVHKMVSNRKEQLKRISTTVRSLTPVGDSSGREESSEEIPIRKSLSLEMLPRHEELQLFSDAEQHCFQDINQESYEEEAVTPDSGQVLVEEGSMGIETADDQTDDTEDSEDGLRQLLDEDDDETDGEIIMKRAYVLNELIETERVYIEDLRQVMQGYYDEMDPSAPFLPPYLRGKRNIIFGNMKRIFQFHNSVFLSELEVVETPSDLAKCFLFNKSEFGLYSDYCKNKIVADEFLQDCDQTFFHSCQKRLGHSLPLTAYLLKPVQRITKYQLLLKDMVNCCQKALTASEKLQESLSCMLTVLKHVNDAMHSIGIEGFRASLIEQGTLLLQDSFRVWDGKDPMFRKEHPRQVFLYEKAVIFSKRRSKQKRTNKTVYSFKNSIKVSELGLTETVGDQPCRFILSQYGETERMFTLQAETLVVKQGWVEQIRRLLSDQLMQIKDIMSGQSGNLAVSSAFKRGFEGRSSVRERLPSRDIAKKLDIHRLWSQESINCPIVRDLHRKKAEETASQLENETLSIVVSKPVDEKREAEPTREMSETASTISRGVSVHSTDSFDSADDWDDDDDDNILDMDLAPDQPRTYSAIADFAYVDQDNQDICYLSLKTGDRVHVVRLGQGGWWFVRQMGETGEDPPSDNSGWVPASFLEVVKETNPVQQDSYQGGEQRDRLQLSPKPVCETPV